MKQESLGTRLAWSDIELLPGQKVLPPEFAICLLVYDPWEPEEC